MATIVKTYINNMRIGVQQSLRNALEYLAEKIDSISTATTKSSELMVAEVLISAADIVATTAGKLGHDAGVPIVAASAATKYVELVSATMLYDYDTAAFGAGGNITINATGGSAVTGLVSNANSLAAAADKVVKFYPLSTAGVNVAINTGFSLVSSVAFTQPGTAAGTVRVLVYYREHSL